MALDAIIARKLVHDTIKPIRSAADCFSLIKLGPESGLNSDVTLLLADGLEHSAKVLQDFGTCSLLELPNECVWETINWKDLVNAQIHRLKSKNKLSFEVELDDGSFESLGVSGVSKYALDNLTWFATHYANQLKHVKLALCTSDGRACLKITYRVKLPLVPGQDVDLRTPFFALSKETLAITHNTGLLLYTVKKIAEFHQGQFNLTVKSDIADLDFLTPVRREREN